MTHELGDSGFGSTVGHDANVKSVVDVFLKRSFNRAADPLVSVTENAAAEQREIDDAVAGSGCICHRGGERGLVGGVENQLSKVGPLVGGLPAVRDGQR